MNRWCSFFPICDCDQIPYDDYWCKSEKKSNHIKIIPIRFAFSTVNCMIMDGGVLRPHKRDGWRDMIVIRLIFKLGQVVHSWLQIQTGMWTTTTSLLWFLTVVWVHIRRKSTIFKSGAQRTTCCSTPAKPTSWLWIFQRRQGHMLPSRSVELRCSRRTVLGSSNQHHREPDMDITHLHSSEKKPRNIFIS